MNAQKYPAMVFWSEADGAFVASSMQLQGCVADGETPQVALDNLQETVNEWLASAKEHHWRIPVPDSLEVYRRFGEEADERSRKLFEQAVTNAVNEILSNVVPRLAETISQTLKAQGAHQFGGARFIEGAFKTELQLK